MSFARQAKIFSLSRYAWRDLKFTKSIVLVLYRIRGVAKEPGGRSAAQARHDIADIDHAVRMAQWGDVMGGIGIVGPGFEHLGPGGFAQDPDICRLRFGGAAGVLHAAGVGAGIFRRQALEGQAGLVRAVQDDAIFEPLVVQVGTLGQDSQG